MHAPCYVLVGCTQSRLQTVAHAETPRATFKPTLILEHLIQVSLPCHLPGTLRWGDSLFVPVTR